MFRLEDPSLSKMQNNQKKLLNTYQWIVCYARQMPRIYPHPYRGKRNEPERVTLVAQQIADLRGMTYEEVCRQTTENAERLFNLN